MVSERTTFDLDDRRIYVAGHGGMVGSAVVRRLASSSAQILTAPRSELDLLDQTAVRTWMHVNRPDVVVVAAARVGGIKANSDHPVDFLADNLGMQLNLIQSSYEVGVKKLLFLGSTCIYPKFAQQPMSEDQLLTGALEPTNEWYAIAKIAGIKLCQAYRRQYGADYISLMPTNLYGPGDNYHPDDSHVVAALIRRLHEAKLAKAPSVTVWGTGTPRREFLHVDDLADACVFALKYYSGDEFLNVGVGEDVSIAKFAELVARTVGFEGQIIYDPLKPDGTPRKLVDIRRLKSLGWQSKINLQDGIERTYQDFLAGRGRGLN